MPIFTTITVLRKSLALSICLTLACSIVLLTSPACLAVADRKAEKQRIEQGLQRYRININKLQDGISQKQELVQSSEKQERSLLTELTEIDHKLMAQLDKLHELKKQMAMQQELIATKEAELQQAVDSKQTVQNHLQERMKSYYKMGKIGIANVAFSAESMPRMLRFRDSFASLIDYDKQLINTYRKAITELQQSRKTLGLEETILDDFITLAHEKQEAINSTKHEKETLLTQIKTQKELHGLAIKEMEKATDSLAASLEALKQENELFDQGFLLNKGTHPAPVHGEITALFGQQRVNRLGITGKSMGLTILAPGMNRVDAIFDGEIRYADYLPGYGNTIIINHGYQYFTIISRLEKILRKKGDTVDQGDLIGLTGDTATLMDEGVYFEIRHGSTPLDPLEWLDETGLTMPQPQINQ